MFKKKFHGVRITSKARTGNIIWYGRSAFTWLADLILNTNTNTFKALHAKDLVPHSQSSLAFLT
jgi:hypothetical protein